MKRKEQTKLPINSLPKSVKAVYALLMLLPAVAVPQSMNTDAYFILNAGRYITQTGTIPSTEVFSQHAGMPAILQQWLTGVIYWFLYSHFGKGALVALSFVLYACIVAVLFKICKKASGNFMLSVLCTSAAMLFISKPFIVTRPLTITFLIILTELYALEEYTRGKAKALFALPALSALLINIQCSMWLMLFVMVLPYAADALKINLKFFKTEHSYKLLPLVLACAGMFAAGFLNPYGTKAMTYLFTSYGYKEINLTVTEMFSPDIKTPSGKFYYLGFLAVILVLVLYKKGRLSVRHSLLLLGCAYLGISSLRSYAFFAFAAAIALSSYLKDVVLTYNYTGTDPKFKQQCTATVLVILLVFAIGLPASADERISGEADLGCEKAVEYALKNYNMNDYTVYNSADIGGYLEFYGIKAHMDPRVELWLKDNNKEADYLKEYVQFQHGSFPYEHYLKKYNFNLLFVNNKEDILSTHLPENPCYEKVYDDGQFSIYELKENLK